MKLFLRSAIVFVGTLLAATLVALGEPGNAEVQMAQMASPDSSAIVVSLLGLEE